MAADQPQFNSVVAAEADGAGMLVGPKPDHFEGTRAKVGIRPNLTSNRAKPQNLTDPISLGKIVGGGNQLFPLSTTLDLLSAFLTLQISFQVDFL